MLNVLVGRPRAAGDPVADVAAISIVVRMVVAKIVAPVYGLWTDCIRMNIQHTRVERVAEAKHNVSKSSEQGLPGDK